MTSTSETSARLLRDGFENHVDVLEELHYKTSRRPIAELCENVLAKLVPIISVACSTIKVAGTIAHTLISYVHSRNSRITELRATPVRLFNDEEKSWPMVEWTEEDKTKSLAIFHFHNVNKPEEGSWVMHSGRQVSVYDRRCWKQSRIDWNVADIEHLKILFGVAQHMLGLLEWPIAEALKICENINSNSTSITEYIPKKL